MRRLGGLAMALALLAGGCGFHLRGGEGLPPQMERLLLLGTPVPGPLGNEIQFAVVAAGASLVTDPGVVTARLHILGERIDQRVLTVDAAGRASEYELRYELRYRLLGPDGSALVPEQRVTSVRDYRFDPNNVLGKEQEQTVLTAEMRRFAVGRMLAQLRLAVQQRDGDAPAP